MLRYLAITTLLTGLAVSGIKSQPSQEWVTYDGFGGLGEGKHIVLISGDEEYRSEEVMPQLGKILSMRHGFRCSVLFSIDREDGTIAPEVLDNIPGLELLADADLMIIATRFRELPDSQMRHIVNYVESGRPIIGMRTATHAFNYSENSTSPFKHYSFRNKKWDGGFGRQVLGETWVAHHGHHGVQSTRGVIPESAGANPIVSGCEEIWGPTDVYEVDLSNCSSCETLVLGQVLSGMKPNDDPVVGIYVPEGRAEREGKTPNDPMMPIAWTKLYETKDGRASRIFTTTMGASVDLLSEGFRRLLVNAVYWSLNMEDRIPEATDVSLVGKYEPTAFGFGRHKAGVRPSDHRLRE